MVKIIYTTIIENQAAAITAAAATKFIIIVAQRFALLINFNVYLTAQSVKIYHIFH